jgi:hypothetical protein
MRETQIPFVVREILGIEDINDVTTLDLSGRGIGDEKMCCVIRSLPYFRSCEEILIAGKKKYYCHYFITTLCIMGYIQDINHMKITIFAIFDCLYLIKCIQEID